MAKKTKSAGAPALAAVVTATASAAVVDGAVTAALVPGPVEAPDSAAMVAAAETTQPVVDAAPAWPRMVTLRNNSGVQLVEPVSGKFLFAFSSETVELRSQEHADAVKDNLRALASVNGLGDALTIEGLPA